MSDILLASLLMGVARCWELVGHRQTGIRSSIAVLSGRDKHHGPEPETTPQSTPRQTINRT
jgi:hypothetical protein